MVELPPPTRAWVTLLVNGGGQPRPWSDGTLKGALARPAKSTA